MKKQVINLLIVFFGLLLLVFFSCESNINSKQGAEMLEGYCDNIFINHFENPDFRKVYHPPEIYFSVVLINKSDQEFIISRNNHDIGGIERSNLILAKNKDTLQLVANYKEDDFILGPKAYYYTKVKKRDS